MSTDKYANSGQKGSLVDNSFEGKQTNYDADYQTGNYPLEGDSTAEGGYGTSTNIWSNAAQRGRVDVGGGNYRGLVDQSLNGGPIGDEIQDAKQGRDERAREVYDDEVKRSFSGEVGLSPYGRNLDNEEAEEILGLRESRDG